MQITRIYYNAAGETLQVERISIDLTPPIGKIYRIGNDPGLQMGLGPQIVKIVALGSSVSLAGNRIVTSIEITGGHDDWDQTGPPYNITWASKTLGSGQVVKFDMSNLPKIGDTI